MIKAIKRTILTSVVLGLLSLSSNALAEFGTLFTTASERQTINENRYLVKKKKVAKTVAKIEVEKTEKEEVIYKVITKEYKISGISIANNGTDSAWINNKLWQNGDIMDNKVQVKVNAKKQKVRLTVRGGKTFYGQSGDTVIVNYNVPISE